MPLIVISLITVLCFNVGPTSETSPNPTTLTLIEKSTGLDAVEWEEGPTELEVADVNGDGYLDIISVGDHGSPFVNSTEHGIMTHLGDGRGNWNVHQLGNFGYGGVAAGDLNLDGLMDLAWGVHHDWGSGGFGDRLMGAVLGDGSGQVWTPWDSGLATSGETYGMFATALADFDLDGKLDVVCQSFGCCNGLRAYRNVGDGSWTSEFVHTGGNAGQAVEVGDIDADGNLDFICSHSDGTVYLGDGAFGFTLNDMGIASTWIRSLDLGDLDGDGYQDVVVALGSSGAQAYRYDSTTGNWQGVSTGLPTAQRVDLVQFGDLTGDGNLDVITYAPNTGKIYLGDGAGNWTADATWTMPSPGDDSALRVDGDIDQDGREDIVVLAEQSGFPVYQNQLKVFSPWSPPVAPSVRVVSPNGGENLRRGSIREIRWVAAVPVVLRPALVSIRLSLDGPNGPWTSIAEDVPNSGRFQWLVSAATPSTSCRVQIELHPRPRLWPAKLRFVLPFPMPSMVVAHSLNDFVISD